MRINYQFNISNENNRLAKLWKIKKIALIVPLFFVFLGGAFVEASWENQFPYEVSVYDYDTGELLSVIWFTAEHPVLENENLLLEIPMDESTWEIGGQSTNVGISTTSKILKIEIDRDDVKFYFHVSGESGTSGKTVLFVTEELAPSPENVRVYLDNQLLNLEFESSRNPWYDYVFWTEYTHSTRVLIFEFQPEISKPFYQPEISKPFYAQPLNLILIVVALVAVFGTLYWFKFRK